jgi:hypothetical protein
MHKIIKSEVQKIFYVWIHPKDIYANYNANVVGSFVSIESKDDNLMFIPNNNFSGYISPFQGNLLRSYLTEYNLEMIRRQYYNQCPSRLTSTFLFESESQAIKYKEIHSEHVGNRELKAGETIGPYTYSLHDLSWIDFLKSPILTDQKIAETIAHNYWKGNSVENFKLDLMDKSLMVISQPVYEVLFLGRIDFKR